MFLLVPVHPGSPEQRAIKRLCGGGVVCVYVALPLLTQQLMRLAL